MAVEKKIKNILFDLDGTIVDSYPGIQQSFNYSFEKIYHTECKHNIRSFVGPPIKDIFVEVTNEKDESKITLFVNLFKEKYDTGFYENSILYDGITGLFNLLKEKDINLYIATNKRSVPTILILKALDIFKYFKKVYCSDSNFKKYNDKSGMINQILLDEDLDPLETVYVGDTVHDMVAAQNNKLNFIYAEYGFGELLNIKNTIYKASELTKYI